MKRRQLRSGYTTGACAAAAAKAAAMLLIRAEQQSSRTAEQQFKMKEHPTVLLRYCATAPIEEVEIPFPDSSRVKFKIQDSRVKIQDGHLTATASVIKDAGDDPDVTNGAEIVAEARFLEQQSSPDLIGTLLHYCATGLAIKGGKGVGVVTKPGLPIPVGEAAINPVPRRMIKEAVSEAVQGFKGSRVQGLEVTISVTNGEKLAKKTLNQRLGIIGGISILGTTGIVKPISAEAWTATIISSMDVAKAMGRSEIVLSAGRSSEKAHMEKFDLPQESYVMMGDYLEFAL
ncbi:MAG: cobalt-precorrin-5B (C(1))-methyltransferase, partial [Nitrospirae bacterium]|nr:cobalt-precorrin-5B (C(1))-methyltransferase [Nitrospirota bacterium]